MLKSIIIKELPLTSEDRTEDLCHLSLLSSERTWQVLVEGYLT